MKIGIGGGIGPFRAGISTRGVGGGIGPLSVGTGWGGRRGGNSDADGCAYLIVLLLAFAAVYFFIAWPFLLGAWVAVKMGASNPSTARTVVGWSFESVWLALILLFAAALLVDTISTRRHSKLVAAYESRHGAEIRRLETDIEVAPDVRAVFTELLEEVENSIGRLSGTDEVARGTVLGRAPAQLIAPRVQERGMPPVQTTVDAGTVTVTSVALQFSGNAKSTQWLHKQVTKSRRQEDRLLIDVANRATIMGIEAPAVALDYIEALTAFARGDIDREIMLVKLREARTAVVDALDFAGEKYAEDSTRLQALWAEHPTHLRATPQERTTVTPSTSPETPTPNPVQVTSPAAQAAPTIKPDAASTKPPKGLEAGPQHGVGNVLWGTKAQHASRKAMPTISGWLTTDEHPVAVFRVNKVNPTLSVLAITDRRVLACDTKPRPGSHPPIDLRRADVAQVHVSGFMSNVAFHTTGGAICKVGNLPHSADAASLKELFESVA